MERETGIGGRHAIEIEFTHVTYRGIDYTVCKITKLTGDPIYFIIDREDVERVKTRSWHSCVSDSYIGSTYTTTDKKRKNLYLHNFIMNRLTFDGKGATETVDHISGNGLDNRKVNLRITTQSLQNMNTKERERTVEGLPSGITAEEIPRGIWYCPPNGKHSYRFVVELKGIPGVGDIVKKCSSSTKMSARQKLDEAIAYKADLFERYPILKEMQRDSERAQLLRHEYTQIVQKAIHGTSDEESPLPSFAPLSSVLTIESAAPAAPAPLSSVLTIEPAAPAAPAEASDVIQWKAKGIYKCIKEGDSDAYKTYVKEHNDPLDTFETLFATLLTNVRGSATFEIAKPFIDSFVKLFRLKRTCKLTKKDVIAREDRDVWPSETIVTAYREKRMEGFKKYITEKSVAANVTTKVFEESYKRFETNMESEPSDAERLLIVRKFLAAQRVQRNRHSKKE
jgi:hypothetical protein